MEKIKETNHFKDSAPFWTSSGKILPKFSRRFAQPATAYIFLLSLFSFAAEESASWEH
jgi:hypothetical protein